MLPLPITFKPRPGSKRGQTIASVLIMKKVLLLLLFTVTYATRTFAHDFVVDGITYNITSRAGNEVEVTSNTIVPYVGDIVIPDSVTYNGTTYVVTAVGDYAFLSSAKLTSVKIGKHVTSIGKSAFDYCLGLLSVEIPDGVTSIGNTAFNGCSKLTKIILPSKLTSIGLATFKHCSSLRSITIPENVPFIENQTFYECTNLTTVILMNKETIVADHAFYGCPKQISITVLEREIEEPAKPDTIIAPNTI